MLAAQRAIKRVEHTLALGHGNARPGVLDAQHGAVLHPAKPQINPPAFGRVANRVVHQVFDQRRQLERAGLHLHVLCVLRALRILHANIDMPGFGQRHQVFEHAAVNALD